MRIAIVGSRGWTDRQAIFDYVAALPKNTVIVSGEAPGADTIAKEAAAHYGLNYTGYPAEWDKYRPPAGKKNPAGMIRNRQIVADCDALVAFWDGDSPGTRAVIAWARKVMRPVKIVTPEKNDA